MSVDYAKVKKIFLEALELPAGEARIAFVKEACGEDIDLFNFVQGMLQAHNEHATPIPEGQTRIDPQYHQNIGPAIPSGTLIGGKYKIVELIAEGGMGSVYRASRVTDLKMEVALKVIKPGMDSRQVLARFNNERQALALMKHENIARVLDAGMTDQHLPYFVMEIVKGCSITAFCDQNKLPIPERLELFEKVCSAVQHAHQKGIVHRDLKPSNILVAMYDEKPVPKVIDFGLAKALHHPLTDEELLTKFGMFVGTWQYTAPEQAQLNNLDIDTRADIYSLGVVLYELLTGTTPVEKKRFANAAYQEVLRMIREEEPPKPSTKIHSSDQLPNIAAQRSSEPLKLERQVRGELDWIVMKALEKERSRRYATANDLAADLQRYRNNEPVQAGPPTFTYRSSKYLRKHWAQTLTAAILIATITLGAVVSTVGWYTAVQERKRADDQTAIAQAVSDFLREDLLSVADPSVQIRPDLKFISNITVKTALDRSAAKVGARFQGKPLVEAAVRFTIGKTYLGLGDLTNARIHLDKAEQLRKQHAGEKSLERLESLYEVAWLDLNETKYQEAELRLKELLPSLEHLVGPDAVPSLKARYASALLLSHKGLMAEAKVQFEQLQQMQIRILGIRNVDTMMTQRELAGVLKAMQQFSQAKQMMMEVLDLQKAVMGGEHPETFVTQNNLALLLDEMKESEKADAILKDLLRVSLPVLGKDHPLFLSFQSSHAGVLISLSKHKDAMDIYRSIVPKLKLTYGPTAYDTLAAMQNLGVLLVVHEKPVEAEPYLLESFQGSRQSMGLNHPRTRDILENIVEMYKKMNKVEKVKEYEGYLATSK